MLQTKQYLCKKIKCTSCLESFVTKKKLYRHYVESHPKNNDTNLNCTNCKEIFGSTEELNLHLEKNDCQRSNECQQRSNPTLNKPYKCNLCKRGFQSRRSVRRHILSIHAKQYLYSCSFCDYTSYNKDGLLKHYRKHHVDEPNYAERNFKPKQVRNLSEKELEELSNLIPTIALMNIPRTKNLRKQPMLPTNQNHVCRSCHRSFKSTNNLKRHILAAHQKQYSYSCSFCHYQCYRKDYLSEHYKDFHINEHNVASWEFELKMTNSEEQKVDENLFKDHWLSCYECPAIMDSKAQVRRHFAAKHPNLNPFKCNYCGETFKQWYTLNSHCNVHTGEKPWHCSTCPERFYDRLDLKRHKIQDHGQRPTCNICGETFSRDTGKGVHMKYVHGSHTFSCTICKDQFRRMESLKIHINREHTKEFVHTCKYCNKSFGDINIMRTHIKNIHRHEENLPPIPRPFKCIICPEAFRWKCQLESHIGSHTKEKPYKCKECGVCFKAETTLKHHVKYIHEDPVEFKCPDCSKTFTQAGTLKRHQETKHNNDNKGKYQCKICKKMLVYKCTLKGHIKKYHS